MSDGHGNPPAPDPRAVALDWITIWQSELSALAYDHELQELWLSLVKHWAHVAEQAARALPMSAHDRAPGRTGPIPSARSAAAMAASDPRDAAIERLAERVAELERRLAIGERGAAI
jgi:hypothetical protein